MADLLDLAARCEAAKGPDRELDALIRCAVFAPEGAYIERSAINGAWCVWTGEGPTGKRRLFDRWPSQAIRLGEFTASLDAGKTLLAPGTLWTVGSMEDGPFARLCWPQPDGGFGGGYIEAKAKTAENALVSAALRARSAQP